MQLFDHIKTKHLPILLLLAANIICGLFVFRDYGLSWDEPLFYDYAHALGYAYSPHEWFSGNFDLENAYGASGTDHANRGPAYLLLAREPVYLLEAFGLDNAAAWHLVNFLTFQLGVYLLYRLALRWMKPWSAFAAAALFSTQPLLWGHAFINPKDPSFLVFLLASILSGFEMADILADETKDKKRKSISVFLAAFLLGIATSIRVLGPLAGLFVLVYLLIKQNFHLSRSIWLYIISYGVIATITMFGTWPYLWPSPLARFLDAFNFMSDNPTQLAVLFNGHPFQANELPRRYLPVLLGITLTEPVWFLFIIGLILGIWKQIHGNKIRNSEFWLILLWFTIPFTYVILRKPPMYDGYRHFLFILPPVFLIAGLAFDHFYERIYSSWIAIATTTIILLPGILGIIQLHPFEYAYYNSFIGGTGGAFRTYETDYWLTCYKQATQQFNAQAVPNARLFIKREPYIAAYYASKDISIHDYRTEFKDIHSGDFVLVNTRANEDIKTFKDAPKVIEVGRASAVFCYVKEIP